MRYFPIFVDLDRQPVLLVGGGEQAAQKLRLLAKTTARVRIVAEALCPELAQAVEAGRAEWLARDFVPEQLDGCRLAYAASDDLGTATRLAFAARARGVPVNAVDRPQLCSFITPAIVDRDPVIVAIGSEGTAPVLVGRIRGMLEAQLPQALGRVARHAAALRRRIARAFADGRTRRVFWERYFDGPIIGRLLAGDGGGGGEHLVDSTIAETGTNATIWGSVTLVGAGPGDPELLTLKAHRALQSADVLVIDRLVDPRVVELARRDARRIHVGKTPHGGHTTSQAAINAILVEEALAGNRVVRLKGGDPFVFGRAVEEIEAVEAHGIPVEIVPGVTAALAAAAQARVPLTERGKRRALTILTGHTKDGPAGDGPGDHDWRALARSGQTLAVYMGVKAGPGIARNLIAAGLDPATPVTIVENATLDTQKTATGRLDQMADLLATAGMNGPAILFIGAAPLPSAATGNISIQLERAA